eukprot:TRINITY_DN7017_c0_g1_i2.p1 TRINITY_DN7017_c0_g1~~TRINITY_DN7017_c0_g1_i2.p1  ORF type:complete len:175 (+),score=46.90 TRINITY_DN7017_c0_g1_i2:53-526(+)
MAEDEPMPPQHWTQEDDQNLGVPVQYGNHWNKRNGEMTEDEAAPQHWSRRSAKNVVKKYPTRWSSKTVGIRNEKRYPPRPQPNQDYSGDEHKAQFARIEASQSSSRSWIVDFSTGAAVGLFMGAMIAAAVVYGLSRRGVPKSSKKTESDSYTQMAAV